MPLLPMPATSWHWGLPCVPARAWRKTASRVEATAQSWLDTASATSPLHKMVHTVHRRRNMPPLRCCRYTVLGRTFVAVSDPAALPAALGLGKSPLAVDGGLSPEAHAGLAAAFGPEGAK